MFNTCSLSPSTRGNEAQRGEVTPLSPHSWAWQKQNSKTRSLGRFPAGRDTLVEPGGMRRFCKIPRNASCLRWWLGVCCRWQPVRGQAREAWPWLLPDLGPGRMDVLSNGCDLCLTFPGQPGAGVPEPGPSHMGLPRASSQGVVCGKWMRKLRGCDVQGCLQSAQASMRLRAGQSPAASVRMFTCTCVSESAYPGGWSLHVCGCVCL